MGALLSSKVNQWTLLIGMLPVVFAVSAGRLGPMEMDQRQVEEMFLTAAQSLFAVAILANLSFSLGEAAIIFVLFSTQLFFPDPLFRFYYSFLYIALALGMVLLKRDARQGIVGLFSRVSSPQVVKSGE
jgi:cation:H+ antiporter